MTIPRKPKISPEELNRLIAHFDVDPRVSGGHNAVPLLEYLDQGELTPPDEDYIHDYTVEEDLWRSKTLVIPAYLSDDDPLVFRIYLKD